MSAEPTDLCQHDAATREQEVEEQIEEDNVKVEARENTTGVTDPMLRGNEELLAAGDAVASREEIKEQIERQRVEKEEFENRISAASAEQWIRNGRIRR